MGQSSVKTTQWKTHSATYVVFQLQNVRPESNHEEANRQIKRKLMMYKNKLKKKNGRLFYETIDLDSEKNQSHKRGWGEAELFWMKRLKRCDNQIH